MSKTLKRVPLDFDWGVNIGQTWKGYTNPYKWTNCKRCDGTGQNDASKKIYDSWFSFDECEWIYVNGENGRRYNNLAWQYNITDDEVEALVRGGRLSDLMENNVWYKFNEELNHWVYLDRDEDKPRSEWEWVKCEEPKLPTSEEVNEWNKTTPLGHDAINRNICVRTRANRLGVYGHCVDCEGEGYIWFSPEIQKMAFDFETYDPPLGEGFQLWSGETDSPITPVFETLDSLCEYCEKNYISYYDEDFITKERWKEILSGLNRIQRETVHK